MRYVSCTRIEAMIQLDELAAGWLHFGDRARWAEAENALDEVRAGYGEVTAGHTVYRIQEAQAS